ncbi:unnamed protein product [Moneuplotes crassus]|uniref:Uncharacterized protein n=1 Tax=Euplotes crassus TaxID=5936 RepID=A0AAD2D5H6_EUPCR|nr:unnamed protein product [Moneuplotes crassus]
MFRDENIDSCDTLCRASSTFVGTTFDPPQRSFQETKQVPPAKAGGTRQIFGRVELEEYQKKAEKERLIQLKKQVRAQENHIARKGKAKEYQDRLKKEQEDKEKYEEYLKYLEQKKEFERQLKLRAEQAEAKRKMEEDFIRRNQELEDKRREEARKRIQDEKIAKERGSQALAKEVQHVTKIANYDNDRRMIERKQGVKKFETELSHNLAKDYRAKEEQRRMQQEIQRKIDENTGIYAYDKNGNKMDNVTLSSESIDYSNTCFHNTLIVKHETDTPMSDKSKTSRSAFETAEEFKGNIERSRIDKLEQKRINDIKAKQRGKQAMEKLNTKQVNFERKPVYQAIGREELQRNTKQRKMETDIEKALNISQHESQKNKSAKEKAKKEETKELIESNELKNSQNKTSSRILMPNVVIEEDIEGEKSECDMLSQESPQASISIQRSEEQPPKIEMEPLPRYPEEVPLQNRGVPHSAPQNYQIPLPQYNQPQVQIQDPNMMMLYQQLLESQQKAQQMENMMSTLGMSSQQMPAAGSQISQPQSSASSYSESSYSEERSKRQEIQISAQKDNSLNMFPNQSSEPVKNNLQNSNCGNGPQINNFLKQNEEVEIINYTDTSQSDITVRSNPEFSKCYDNSEELSSTSEEEYGQQPSQNLAKKEIQINPSLVSPTMEGRQVVLSRKEVPNPVGQKYSHLLPGGSQSESSSQFADEFLNNEAPTMSEEILSSSELSQSDNGSQLRSDALSESYTSDMTEELQKSKISANFYTTNELTYSYSDIDPQDSNSQHFDEFIGNNKPSNPSQMQVFTYEPVFGSQAIQKEPQIESEAAPEASRQPLNMYIPHKELGKPSLADEFRSRKKQISQSGFPMTNQKLAAPTFEESYGNSNQENIPQNQQKSSQKLYAGGRTKEQILAQRREMMKPKSKAANSNKSNSTLEKLAKGEKLPTNKKEMLKFTKKNYDKLPEVQKKREEERRKKEKKELLKKVKENEQRRREMIRNNC